MSWIRMGMIVRMGLDLNMHRTGKVDMGSTPEWRVRSVRLTYASHAAHSRVADRCGVPG